MSEYPHVRISVAAESTPLHGFLATLAALLYPAYSVGVLSVP